MCLLRRELCKQGSYSVHAPPLGQLLIPFSSLLREGRRGHPLHCEQSCLIDCEALR